MIRWRFLWAVAAVSLCACGERAPGPGQTPAQAPVSRTVDEHELPAFVGRVWRLITPGHAPGTLRIFLADRTLVMTSCVETYRLSQWGIAGENIRWLEDTIPIEAEYEMPTRDELVLRIAGQDREQSFVAARVPYVCPDLPR